MTRGRANALTAALAVGLPILGYASGLALRAAPTPHRGDLHTIPERCKGEEGARLRREGSDRDRLECAWAYFRRGCALGHQASCEAQRRAERELLEMAAGSPDR